MCRWYEARDVNRSPMSKPRIIAMSVMRSKQGTEGNGQVISEISRRDFLAVAGKGAIAAAGLAAAVGVGRYLALDPNPPAATKFTLQPPASYPVGSATFLAEARAWLVRDTHGFFAMSGICTHLGCSLKRSSEGSECPCHGSRFAAAGRVISGRAQRPLRRVLVGRDDAGRLWVDTSREVEAHFRAKG